eukprot:scaffold83105_cov67-Phaeocystis_antarctica.AAC.10
MAGLTGILRSLKTYGWPSGQRQRGEKQREERCAQERLEAERAAADKVAEEQRRQEKAAEARQQAQAEGLVLRAAKNKTGYAGVHLHTTGKPYEAKGRRGGQASELGHLCHRRGGGDVRSAIARGAGGSGGGGGCGGGGCGGGGGNREAGGSDGGCGLSKDQRYRARKRAAAVAAAAAR